MQAAAAETASCIPQADPAPPSVGAADYPGRKVDHHAQSPVGRETTSVPVLRVALSLRLCPRARRGCSSSPRPPRGNRRSCIATAISSVTLKERSRSSERNRHRLHLQQGRHDLHRREPGPVRRLSFLHLRRPDLPGAKRPRRQLSADDARRQEGLPRRHRQRQGIHRLQHGQLHVHRSFSPGEKNGPRTAWRYTRMIGAGYMGHNEVQKGYFTYLDRKFPGNGDGARPITARRSVVCLQSADAGYARDHGDGRGEADRQSLRAARPIRLPGRGCRARAASSTRRWATRPRSGRTRSS